MISRQKAAGRQNLRRNHYNRNGTRSLANTGAVHRAINGLPPEALTGSRRRISW